MNQFITLSKSDDQFWPMLTGEFSKTHFAQPIRNMNVSSDQETVTFKLVERPSLGLFSALSHWYSVARNIYLIFPVIGGISYLMATYGMADPSLVVSSILSLQMFLMALTLYNDYSDYVSGVDRVNEFSHAKPLMAGFMRPFQARQLALVFLFFAIVFGLYCVWMNPGVLVFALAALGIGGTIALTRWSRRLKALGLITSFLLGGPLLVLGYEYLLFNQLSLTSALLGGVFGIHALKYDFCKQVRDIFYNSKANVKTLSTHFGFEGSKKIYAFINLLHIVLLSVFAYFSGHFEVLPILVVALCFDTYLSILFVGAPSFMSSNIGTCMSLQKLHYTIECSLFSFFFLGPLWLSL